MARFIFFTLLGPFFAVISSQLIKPWLGPTTGRLIFSLALVSGLILSSLSLGAWPTLDPESQHLWIYVVAVGFLVLPLKKEAVLLLGLLIFGVLLIVWPHLRFLWDLPRAAYHLVVLSLFAVSWVRGDRHQGIVLATRSRLSLLLVMTLSLALLRMMVGQWAGVPLCLGVSAMLVGCLAFNTSPSDVSPLGLFFALNLCNAYFFLDLQGWAALLLLSPWFYVPAMAYRWNGHHPLKQILLVSLLSAIGPAIGIYFQVLSY